MEAGGGRSVATDLAASSSSGNFQSGPGHSVKIKRVHTFITDQPPSDNKHPVPRFVDNSSSMRPRAWCEVIPSCDYSRPIFSSGAKLYQLPWSRFS